MSSIFHYTKLSTLVEHILPTKSLKTNGFSAMNDPREFETWAFGTTNLPIEDLFGEYYNPSTHIDCQYKFGQIIKERLRVICFSGANDKGWNNEMMWAHYSQNHLGVCLEFDLEKLSTCVSETFPGLKYVIGDVDYGFFNDTPWIYWNRNLGKEENFDLIISKHYKDLALRKSHFWEKEDEKRLLVLNQKADFLIPFKSSLTGIYLGLNFPHQYLPAIESQIENMNIELYDVIYQFYQYERWLRQPKSTKIPISRLK